ncbi:MAG: hypothetical protein FJY97_06875 [candidate division Zixibacteria bacterium]|nr:hypothetical protein [candidate division Zixibacteria bacterium]
MRRLVIPVSGVILAITLLLFDLTILGSGPTALRSTAQKGVALGIHRASEGVAPYRAALDEIAALGTRHVSVPVYFFQDSVHSVTLFSKPTDGATPAQYDRVIRSVVEYAHRLGMKVFLSPIVDIDHPEEGQWRGTISPSDWSVWFDSYRAFLLHYARLAEELDVEFMSVGTELVSTERFTEEWIETIQTVRAVYRGQLTYSANWDHYHEIAFWGPLDFLGISGYFELVSFQNPTTAELVEGWTPIKAELLAWQTRWNKPLLFVEIGYTSQEGSSSQPWNYTAKAPFDSEEQRRCYEAFRLVWENESALAGWYFWIWEPDRRGPGDTGYTFAGKPAEGVVQAWFRSLPPNATLLDAGVNAIERLLRSLREGV